VIAPGASPSRRLLNRARGLAIGLTGLAVLVLVGLGGQAIWVLRADGSVGLADSLAIEGVIAAVVFGILALNVALRHERDLKRVSGTLNDVSGRLDRVTHSILTRTIGPFPDFIPHITALLEQAETSILVMCDNPAYGFVSNGDAFDPYLVELKRQIARRASNPSFSVELMFLAAQEREELHRDQLKVHAKTDEEWERWRDQNTPHEELEAFLRRAHSVCKPGVRPLSDDDISMKLAQFSRDDFVECLAEVNDVILKHHLYGAKKYVLRLRNMVGASLALPLGPTNYFWMRDGRHAIFAVVPLGDEPEQRREVAFETHDPNLIDALKGTFSRYLTAAGEDVT
jgi:hypothetical protein